MSTTGRVIKNISSFSAATFVTRLLGAVVGILIARYFGVNEFGQFATAFAFINMFLICTDIGLGRLLVREGSRDESSTGLYLGNTLLFMFLFSVILYAAMVLIAVLLNYETAVVQLITVLGVSMFILGFQQRLFYSVLQTYQRLDLSALLEVLTSFLTVIFVVIVVRWRWTLIQFAYSKLLVSVLTGALTVVITLRFARPKYAIKRLGRMIKDAVPFGLSDIFYVFYFQINTVMLSIMRSEADVGIYSAAGRLIGPLLFVAHIINKAILPITFKLFVNRQQDLKRTYHLLFHYLSMFSIPLTVALFFASKTIIHLFYGAEFEASATVFQILCWIVFLRFLNTSACTILTSIDKQALKTWYQGVMSVANIVINIFLIPKYGYMGAAISILVTELIITVLYFWSAAKHFEKVGVFTGLIKPVVAGCAMTLTILILHGFIGDLPSIPVGIIVYLVVLIAIKFFNDEDRMLLSKIVGNRRIGRFVHTFILK